MGKSGIIDHSNRLSIRVRLFQETAQEKSCTVRQQVYLLIYNVADLSRTSSSYRGNGVRCDKFIKWHMPQIVIYATYESSHFRYNLRQFLM